MERGPFHERIVSGSIPLSATQYNDGGCSSMVEREVVALDTAVRIRSVTRLMVRSHSGLVRTPAKGKGVKSPVGSNPTRTA